MAISAPGTVPDSGGVKGCGARGKGESDVSHVSTPARTADLASDDLLLGFEAAEREVMRDVEMHVDVESDADCRRPRLLQSAGQRLARRHRDRVPDWVETRPGRWVGEFRAARAHRLPPDVAWEEVEHLRVVDMATDEVLEDGSAPESRGDDLVRRLDRVRDVRVQVTLKPKAPVVNQIETSQWAQHALEVRPLAPKVRWSELDSEGESEA